MSCYEWEKGTIVIPSAAWAGFKKAIRDAWNKAIAEDFETAGRILDAVRTANKGKRNVSWREAIIVEAERREADFSRWGGSSRPTYQLKALDAYWLARTLVPDGAERPRNLKQKDVPWATRATVEFRDLGGDGFVGLIEESHSVAWIVAQNNHACERARESFLGGLFFKTLKSVTWTRGSGGVIVGNDEYNRDDDSPGGGGNRINDQFGPLGERYSRAAY
jgi:hypothetical protein